MGGFGCIPLGILARSATDTTDLFFRGDSVSFALHFSVTLVYIWASGMRANWQMGAGKLCLVNIITGQWAQILSRSWTVFFFFFGWGVTHCTWSRKIEQNIEWVKVGKTDGFYVKEEDLKVGGRQVESEWKGQREKKNDVPASSVIFGLLLLAYHGNNCLDHAHLGSRPQGLMIINTGRLRWMEKESEISCRERIRGMSEGGGGGGYRWCHSWCGAMAKRCPAATVINQISCWWLCWPKWTISLIGVSIVHP